MVDTASYANMKEAFKMSDFFASVGISAVFTVTVYSIKKIYDYFYYKRW